MKAVRIHEHGGPEVVRYENAPEPHLRAGEALLEVRATSVNHLDLWVRRGMPGITIPMPRTLGCDAAGILREVPEGCRFTPGTRVVVNPGRSCGECEFCTNGRSTLCANFSVLGEHRDGSDAEFLAVPPSGCVEIPDSFSFEQAAAVPLVYLTAWSMLITKANIRPGEDVLILGAGSGVGSACIEIARMTGCRVLATASSEAKLQRARDLGAEFAFNHTTEDVDRKIRELTKKRGVDVVVDYIGKDTWVKSLRSLRRGGRLITCGATSGYDPATDIRQIFYRQLQILGSTLGNQKELQDVLKCIFEGRLKPVVDRVLPFSQAAEAHRLIEGRQVFGKIVLVPG